MFNKKIAIVNILWAQSQDILFKKQANTPYPDNSVFSIQFILERNENKLIHLLTKTEVKSPVINVLHGKPHLL